MHFNLSSLCLHCSKRALLYVVISVSSLWIQSFVKGQGRMLQPPSRTSMWRFGYDTTVNHNDNVLNCGGTVYRYSKANGKCGACGEAWNIGPRDSESANGIITGVYNPGSTIDVVIDDVVENGGFFEFHLCEYNKYPVPESNECFEKVSLTIVNSTDYKFRDIRNGENKIQLVLPETVTCERCVLRWKYRTAEHYGCETVNGQEKCCFGCGEIQNEYYACADIAIVSGDKSSYYGYRSLNENIEAKTLRRKKRAPLSMRRMQEGIEVMSAGPVQSVLLPYMSLLNRARNRRPKTRTIANIRTLNGGTLNRQDMLPSGFNRDNPPIRSMVRVDNPVIRTPISRSSSQPRSRIRSAVRIDRPATGRTISLNGRQGPISLNGGGSIFSWFSPSERPDMRNTFISPISPTADALMIRPVISDPVDKYRNPSSCKAIGPFRTKEMDQWCQQQCSGGNCVINECTCNGKRHPSVKKQNCEQCPYGKCIEQTAQWSKSPQLNSLYPGVFNNYSNFLECSNYDRIYGLGNYKVLAEGLPDCGPHPSFRFKRQVSVPLEEEAAYGCCGTRPQVIMPLTVKSKKVSYNVVQLPEDRNQFLVRGVCGRNSTGSCPMCVPEYNFQWVLVYDEKLNTDPPVNFVPVKFAHYCRCINPGYNLG